MKINSIYLENIRSYDKQEIKLPDGATLLSGNIGSGKSSVLLALEFALFGLQKGLSGSTLLRNGKDEGKVIVELEIDKKKVLIERMIKRHKSSITQDYGSISINDLKKELSTSEMRDKILKLLNYPSEFLTKNPVLYNYTVYTPQEEMKQILQEDKDSRLDILRKVFGMDNYKKIISNTDIIDKKLREIVKSKEGFISDLDRKKQEIEERKKRKANFRIEIEKFIPELTIVQRSIDEKKKNLQEIEEKIRELNKTKTEIASIKAELREKNVSLKLNREEIDNLNEQIEKFENELDKDIKNIEESSKYIETELSSNEKEQEIIKRNQILIEKKIATTESNKQQKEKLMQDILKLNSCPTCKQQVSQDYKNEIKERIDSEIKTLDENLISEENNKKEIEAKLSEIGEKIKSLLRKEREINIFAVKIKNLDEKKLRKEKFFKYNEKLNSEILSLNEQEKELMQKLEILKDIEEDYISLKKILDEESRKERQIEIKKAEVEQEFKSISEIIEFIEKEIIEKDIEKERCMYINKIRNWFSHQFIPLIELIERNIMIKIHQDFSKLFEKWFSMLAEGLTAKLDNEFTPIIEQQGYQIDYAHLSGGERTAAALAYRLSLNQVINNLVSNIRTRDILILDEPTDGFSSEQLNKMRPVLDELKIKQLILVSHEPKMEEFVDHILRFDKKEFTIIQ